MGGGGGDTVSCTCAYGFPASQSGGGNLVFCQVSVQPPFPIPRTITPFLFHVLTRGMRGERVGDEEELSAVNLFAKSDEEQWVTSSRLRDACNRSEAPPLQLLSLANNQCSIAASLITIYWLKNVAVEASAIILAGPAVAIYQSDL